MSKVAAKSETAKLAIQVSDVIALIEAGRVDEARVLVNQLLPNNPDSPSIRHLQRVLELPSVTTIDAAPRTSFTRERTWLKAHAHEHPGCWIAVVDGCLIAASPSRTAVVQAVREALGNRGAVLFYQAGDSV